MTEREVKKIVITGISNILRTEPGLKCFQLDSGIKSHPGIQEIVDDLVVLAREAAQEQQIGTLREALKKYGKHPFGSHATWGCPAGCPDKWIMGCGSSHHCVCGLDALLSSLPQLPPDPRDARIKELVKVLKEGKPFLLYCPIDGAADVYNKVEKILSSLPALPPDPREGRIKRLKEALEYIYRKSSEGEIVELCKEVLNSFYAEAQGKGDVA